MLATMHDDLMEVVRLRPGTVVGAVRETYELLADALREPVSPECGRA
ncbi:hypothetical protein [Micromonospora sp. KLBMP9576]